MIMVGHLKYPAGLKNQLLNRENLDKTGADFAIVTEP